MERERPINGGDGVGGRSYGDACGAAHALDLVGERWALLVMRELMLSPKRFTDLRAGLPGISANVLTQRLEKLEAVGIVERRELPPPAGRAYALTPWGLEAEPILVALGRWAARSPLHDATQDFSATSLILSMRTMFRPHKADGVAVAVGFRIGRETFRADVAAGALTIAPAPLAGCEAVLAGTPSALAQAVYSGLPLAETGVELTGDRAAAERYLALFELPPKVFRPE